MFLKLFNANTALQGLNRNICFKRNTICATLGDRVEQANKHVKIVFEHHPVFGKCGEPGLILAVNRMIGCHYGCLGKRRPLRGLSKKVSVFLLFASLPCSYSCRSTKTRIRKMSVSTSVFLTVSHVQCPFHEVLSTYSDHLLQRQHEPE